MTNNQPSTTRYNDITSRNRLRNKGKRYTEYEDDMLILHYGSRSIDRLATSLGRTPASVTRRAERLGISDINISLNAVSPNQLSQAFNVASTRVYRLIKNKGLPVDTERYASTRNADSRYTTRRVVITEFWEWYKDNLQLLPLQRYVEGSLPPEPEWLQEAQRTYTPPPEPKKWTDKEDRILRSGIGRGKSYKDIAHTLERSEMSVIKRFIRLTE